MIHAGICEYSCDDLDQLSEDARHFHRCVVTADDLSPHNFSAVESMSNIPECATGYEVDACVNDDGAVVVPADEKWVVQGHGSNAQRKVRLNLRWIVRQASAQRGRSSATRSEAGGGFLFRDVEVSGQADSVRSFSLCCTIRRLY